MFSYLLTSAWFLSLLQVTIFGESAGATSVCAHITAKHSAGLFRAGLMQSGFCTVGEYQAQIQIGQQIAEAIGCKDSNTVSQ